MKRNQTISCNFIVKLRKISFFVFLALTRHYRLEIHSLTHEFVTCNILLLNKFLYQALKMQLEFLPTHGNPNIQFCIYSIKLEPSIIFKKKSL